MYDLLRGDVAISDAVHRALNNVVNKMTDGHVSGWQDNYRIYLGSDGQVDARSTEQNNRGDFQSGLTTKLIFLPTPGWIQGTEQKVYICFYYELAELMKTWWREYAYLIR